MLDHLPQEIRTSARAVVWKHEIRDGKPTKVPYQPHRPHEKAAVDNPATWNTFTTAYDAVVDGKADGPGIVLGDGDVGIDLDKVRNPETGEITVAAAALIRELDSYTEVSPSGTGVHIIVRGTLPPGGRRKGGIEMYADLRYFTITGQHLTGTPTQIHDRTAQLAAVHARVFGTEPARPTPPPSRPSQATTLDDAALLVKASAATNGSTFSALWAGDVSAYDGDDSAADLALCNLLAFWAGTDPDRMDRLFRQSGLMRPKWDARRGQQTYGAITIDKAIAGCRETYTPPVIIEFDEPVAADAARTRPPGDRPVDWPVLAPVALTGLLGDAVRALAPHTEADHVALLTHLQVQFGSLIGRTPHVIVGATGHHANENILVVGDTSLGRKGTADAEATALMRDVDPDWAGTRIVTGLSSGEGLIAGVRDPDDAADDPGVLDKRLLVKESEFAKVLRVGRREGNTLSAVMRQAWDDGALQTLTRGTPLRATGAHIAIIGHVTAQELRKELKSTDLANGFVNRFVILLVHRSQCLPDAGRMDPGLYLGLVRRLTAAVSAARRATELRRDEEACEHWRQIYPQLTGGRPGLLGAVCNRATAHVIRLSLLYALADGSSTIQLVHQQAAKAVWDYAEASCQIIFGVKTGQRLADYLLRHLRSEPAGLTQTDIYNACGRNKAADEISEAIDLLQEYGLVRSERDASKPGRPVTRWFADAATH